MRIRDVDLNVQISGAGMPFVWAHGLMYSMEAEDSFNWLRWQDMPNNVLLIRYDARGHGKSQASHQPESYRWSNLGQDMLAIADAAGEKKFIAGGASMGCATALYAALQAPERIKALVLVIPPTIWETRAAQSQLYRRTAMLGGALGGERLAKLMGSNMAASIPAWMLEGRPDSLEHAQQRLRVMSRQSLWHLFRGAAQSDLPSEEAFSVLAKIPAIIISWSGDSTHPVSSATELHRLLPQSELFIAQNYEEFTCIPQQIQGFIRKQLG